MNIKNLQKHIYLLNNIITEAWERAGTDKKIEIQAMQRYINEHVTIQRDNIKMALDYLLDIAEKYQPDYSSDDEIMKINDLYKKIYD